MSGIVRSTPQPSVAASAIAVNPSRTLLIASRLASPLRPFWIEPRNVSGPTQNTIAAVTNASATVPGEATLQGRAEIGQGTIDPPQRAAHAAEQDAAEHVEEVRRVDREL